MIRNRLKQTTSTNGRFETCYNLFGDVSDRLVVVSSPKQGTEYP